MTSFDDDVALRVRALREDAGLKARATDFMRESIGAQYSYNFRWMGRPIIQYPQDMIAMQEILWDVRPDLIVETGIAHGGSLVYYASLCELMGHGEVLGIDIDIRPHNREAIETHPMFKRIHLMQGSSTDPAIVTQVHAIAAGKKVLVVLDSNHTHDHVLAELQAYAPLVSVGSYCVVFDTVVEDLPRGLYPTRPWDVGNNPKTAVHEFLRGDDRFEIDRDIEAKIQITVAPDGYLRRVK
ncbi:MAG TPA: cephalosporin hydroxylase family protein [Luteimonas sp.]|nr:cephalosporin hydroxylase family protein [Luteimonas sp.]